MGDPSGRSDCLSCVTPGSWEPPAGAGGEPDPARDRPGHQVQRADGHVEPVERSQGRCGRERGGACRGQGWATEGAWPIVGRECELPVQTRWERERARDRPQECLCLHFVSQRQASRMPMFTLCEAETGLKNAYVFTLWARDRPQECLCVHFVRQRQASRMPMFTLCA